MVVPSGMTAKKADYETPYDVSAYIEPEVTVEQPRERVVWGVWSSGLVVAVISAFIFPFLGVPAALVAIFAYVDFKTNDQEGYKRKRKIARCLGAVALIIGIILMGMMFACRMYRWHKHHHRRPYGNDGIISPHYYCHRPNRDCYGRDIAHLKGVTLNQCQHACDGNPSCVSIQYNRDSCWLKEHRCTATELRIAPGANDYVKTSDDYMNCPMMSDEYHTTDYCARPGVSCQMNRNYCHRPNSDCVFHDIKHSYADLKTCLDACDAEPECKSIQQRGNDCWLKNHVCNKTDLTVAGGRHDFVKRQPGESCTGL